MAGIWLDDCHRWGLEFDYFTLGEDSANYSANSPTGDPILARPFFNDNPAVPANIGVIEESRELVAYPGVIVGTVTVNAKDFFQSAGALLSRNIYCCQSVLRTVRRLRQGGGVRTCCGTACCGDSCSGPLFGCRVDLVGGYRFYRSQRQRRDQREPASARRRRF